MKRRSSLSKLTEEQAADIRIRYAAGGITQQQLADEYGVAQTKISNVICGKTYTEKRSGVQKGHKFGPQSPEHIAKRFANGAGPQVGKKQTLEHRKAAADARRGKKQGCSAAKSAAMHKKWGSGVYDDLFKRQAKFPYNGINMRSNWERMAAQCFDKHGILWTYEPRKFRLPTGQYYHPDFHLPAHDLWIEVKGFCTYTALAKFDLFTGLGYRTAFLTGQNDDEYQEELEGLATELVA